jgi:hypothetical protein
MVYFSYCFGLLVYGVLNGNFISFVYADVMAFGSAIFIFMPGWRNDKYIFFTDTLPKIGSVVNAISIFSVLFYISKYGLIMASIDTGRGLGTSSAKIMSPKHLLYGSFFIFPLVVYVKSNIGKSMYYMGMVCFVFFSLAMASRGTTIMAVFLFLLTILYSSKEKVSISGLFNKKFFLIIVGILVFGVILYQIPAVKASVEYLVFRFTNDDREIGAARTKEATEILTSLNTFELFFGKGIGAANVYWIFAAVENGVNNVHYGWVFLILKGGITFLVLIYGKIILSIKKLWFKQDLQPYAFILIIFLMTEMSHTTFNSFYKLSFIFLAIFASGLPSRKKQLNG